jgi:hypothetical protein
MWKVIDHKGKLAITNDRQIYVFNQPAGDLPSRLSQLGGSFAITNYISFYDNKTRKACLFDKRQAERIIKVPQR